jgi:hypothetical protein
VRGLGLEIVQLINQERELARDQERAKAKLEEKGKALEGKVQALGQLERAVERSASDQARVRGLLEKRGQELEEMRGRLQEGRERVRGLLA